MAQWLLYVPPGTLKNSTLCQKTHLQYVLCGSQEKKTDYFNRCPSINDTDTAGFTSIQNIGQNLVLCILILIFFERKLLEDKCILCHPRFPYSVQKTQPLLPILKMGIEPMPCHPISLISILVSPSNPHLQFCTHSSLPLSMSQTFRPSNPDTTHEPQ